MQYQHFDSYIKSYFKHILFVLNLPGFNRTVNEHNTSFDSKFRYLELPAQVPSRSVLYLNSLKAPEWSF